MKEHLTNEKLKKLFKNNFDLASYAIRLAEYYIRSGHEVHVDDLLEEIRKNPHEYTAEQLRHPERRNEESE